MKKSTIFLIQQESLQPEHVASPSVELHVRFLNAIGYSPKTEDKSNKLLPMETQLGWLREIGFVDVDCYWKWLNGTV